MISDKIHVAIRSYKRAGQVTTLKVIPFAYVWCPESQADDYRQHYGDRVIAIPDSEDGNSSRKFNTILDRTPAKWTLILDDDITIIAKYEQGRRYILSPPDIAWMIEHCFDLADQLGIKLWGVNQYHDPMGYRAYTPYSFLAPILGPMTGHLEPELRYDESVPLKEDYDFWLQNIQRYHRTLRASKYHYHHNHGTKAGGVVSQRTYAAELECERRMIAKWGSNVYLRAGGQMGGKAATGENVMNSVVRVPIEGI